MEENINYHDEYKIRLKRLEKIIERGVEPYPSRAEATHGLSEVLEKFESLEKEKSPLILVGRMRSIRLHGGSCFASLESDNARLQLYFKKDQLGAEEYQFFCDTIDVGDFIQAGGRVFVTQRGERTLLVDSYKLLSKSLLPLPEKWHGLKDIEARYRQRYLDLLANPQTREIFRKRSRIVQYIRNHFIKEGFLEVETPVLQPVASGAIALPFKTHHNALKTDLYLRIAPEIYLKELVVGGFEKVFEIARCFRNEGIDFAHNPEFTQIEFYWAYKDYEFLMGYMEEFLAGLVNEICGALRIEYDGQALDFTPPFAKLDFRQALIDQAGIDLDEHDLKSLEAAARKKGLKTDKSWGKGKLADELFKEFVRPKLVNPTYLINHPIELSPLAKRLAGRPDYVERFQLIAGGKIELLNAFTELNNPLEQEERFKFQQQLSKKGDKESMNKDEEFVTALKYGLPPTVGLGMGIERLVNILTDTRNIKEVVFFPALKPEK